ncbi:MAG: hypothetical protein KDB03_11940 [Planctomycetales bacterium]|nr:hypothetical protein [Planctomycetales bacterium]
MTVTYYLQERGKVFDQEPTATSHAPRTGFSLAWLFYLITICAILAACIRPTIIDRESLSVGIVTLAFVVGSQIGWLFGWFYAWHRQWRKWRGVLVGGFVGMMAGPVTLNPVESFPYVATTALVGTWLILMLLFVFIRSDV